MVIDTLKNNNVDYVFGIPGAKIDYLFNALEDDGPELNCYKTRTKCSYDGARYWTYYRKTWCRSCNKWTRVSNLTTGLLTATSEGDPVLAIGGQVKRVIYYVSLIKQ